MAAGRPEILLTMPIYAPVMAQLARDYELRKLWLAKDPERYLHEHCGAVRAVVTVGARMLRADVIDRLPKLELIACFGNPDGTIAPEPVARRGLTVTNTPDDIIGTVAELAVGMTIALLRRIVENDRFLRSGKWLDGPPLPGTSLAGKTCGIVGLGRIGRETAARLRAFGMKIGYHGPRAKADVPFRYYADPVSLAGEADCLVITCPDTPQTRNLIDADVLNALGPEGFLVNVARGPIVNEQALIEALTAKRIAGAALDVFWDEPRVPEALIAMDNVVLLPHIGSTTREVREERGRKLMANLRAHFAGERVPYPTKEL